VITIPVDVRPEKLCTGETDWSVPWHATRDDDVHVIRRVGGAQEKGRGSGLGIAESNSGSCYFVPPNTAKMLYL
jgi:hypothetical protein